MTTAAGEEHAPVVPARDLPGPKSVGNGLTYPRNLRGWAELRSALTELADEVAARLRRHTLKCTAVQVTIRDPDFRDICRQKKLAAPTYVSRDLAEAAMELVKASWREKSPGARPSPSPPRTWWRRWTRGSSWTCSPPTPPPGGTSWRSWKKPWTASGTGSAGRAISPASPHPPGGPPAHPARAAGGGQADGA